MIKAKEIKKNTIKVRLSDKELQQLEKKCKKADLTKSAFIRLSLSTTKANSASSDMKYLKTAALAEEICNYIRKNFPSDKTLEGMVNDLWKSLS